MAQVNPSVRYADVLSKAETQGNILKSTQKRILCWIAHWAFFIGFKLVGLFVLWTFSMLFDEESRLAVKK